MSYVFSNTEAKSNKPVAKSRVAKKRRRRKLGIVLDSWVSDLVDFS